MNRAPQWNSCAPCWIASAIAIILVGCQESSAPQQGAAQAPIAANHAPEALPENGNAGDIRVALTDDSVESITIEAASVVAIRDRNGRAIGSIPEKSKIRVERERSDWKVGDELIDASSFEMHAATSPGLWVNDRLYRGFLRFVADGKQSFLIVNVLPLEHYIAGVIDGEMPIDFPVESRKAQAVAARSFAIMQRLRANADAEYDLFASPLKSQHYRGYQYRDARGAVKAGESDAARRATGETLGLVCARDGELFRTYYSACCGGQTTQGSLYFPDASEIPSVACNACDACPKHRWSLRLTAEELSAAVRKAANGRVAKAFQVATAEVDGISDRNHIPQVRFEDAAGKTMTVAGDSLRSAIGVNKLFSGWFTIRRDGDDFLLEGRGYGHGVGMCQWGAAGLAKQGTDFTAILTRYYPGCEIQPLTASMTRPDDGANHGHGTRQHRDD